MAGLEYISSAGLRVVLSAHKTMMNCEGLVIKNVNEEIKDIFDITGFSDILNIEE
jgi:anti-sigma B factor antagonist